MAMARPRARGCGRLLLILLPALQFLAGAAAALHGAPAPRASSPSISAAPESPPPHPRLPSQQHHGRHALPPALLSPDIMPVLPSPAEDGAAPPPGAEEPTIPSSPSPPNPDALEPDWALAPLGSSAPAVARQSPAVPSASAAAALPLLGLLLAVLRLLLV